MPKHSFVYERNRQDLQVDRRRLDVAQVAQRLQVSRRTVYRLINEGKLAAARFGTSRGYQIWESSVEEYEKQKADEAAGAAP
jgi:excisionase family DNA binding protein